MTTVESEQSAPMPLRLPNPRYKVSLPTKEGKGGHFYAVEHLNEKFTFRGITTYLNIISKPALVGWAKQEALESARKAFYDAEVPCAATDWHAFVDEVISKASKRPKELSEKAMGLGTLLHDTIEKWIKKEITKPPVDIEKPFNNFLNWVKSENISFIDAEVPCASTRYGYATKVDAVAYNNGHWEVFELKSSKNIYDEYLLQTAAEMVALEETYDICISKGFVARFGVDGDFQKERDIRPLQNPGKAFHGFILAKELWEIMNET